MLAACYRVVSVCLIQCGRMSAEWQTDRHFKNANEGVGSPAPFGRDTTLVTPFVSVCLVCRATGGGGATSRNGKSAAGGGKPAGAGMRIKGAFILNHCYFFFMKRVRAGPPVWHAGSQLMTFFASNEILGSDTTSPQTRINLGQGLHGQGGKILWLMVIQNRNLGFREFPRNGQKKRSSCRKGPFGVVRRNATTRKSVVSWLSLLGD